MYYYIFIRVVVDAIVIYTNRLFTFFFLHLIFESVCLPGIIQKLCKIMPSKLFILRWEQVYLARCFWTWSLNGCWLSYRWRATNCVDTENERGGERERQIQNWHATLLRACVCVCICVIYGFWIEWSSKLTNEMVGTHVCELIILHLNVPNIYIREWGESLYEMQRCNCHSFETYCICSDACTWQICKSELRFNFRINDFHPSLTS